MLPRDLDGYSLDFKPVVTRGQVTAQHLDDLLEIIDMLNTRCPAASRVIKGFNTCVYRGNWKLLLENASGDGLHLPYTHRTLMQMVSGARWNDASFGMRSAIHGQDDETRVAGDVHPRHGGQFGYEGNCLEQYQQ